MAQDDPDGTFGPMQRGDVVKNFVPYAPIKVGSAYYKRPTSEQAFPVYVENLIVRDIQLVALPKQPDILQLRAEDSKKIVLRAPSCASKKRRRRRRTCFLERAGSFTTARRCHGMLAPSRQRDK